MLSMAAGAMAAPILLISVIPLSMERPGITSVILIPRPLFSNIKAPDPVTVQFDYLDKSNRFDEDTWEKSEAQMQTGPAMVNICAPIPRTHPSALASIASDTTELAKPVIGTMVPAPACLPILSKMPMPVRQAVKKS